MFENELILYVSEDGQTKVQLRTADNTVWLTQDEISNLFQKARSTIAEHIQNIFTDKELEPDSVCRNFRRTGSDGKTYEVQHYNLDLTLSVGYRVKSARGIQFRQWATTTLKEYLIKGFAIDGERLKNPGGIDYFDELLERIREIRSSEKRFYQKIKDIYNLSADYQSSSEQAQLFFKIVQNKMLWATTSKTAAELITERANSSLPNMGLTSWEGSRVRKKDVTISKNYLNQDEIFELNRVVTMFLDFAEDQAKRRQIMYMKDWEERLDAFLTFNDRPVLDHAGTITHENAEKIASECYATFDLNRRKQEQIQSEKEALEELQKLEKSIRVESEQ